MILLGCSVSPSISINASGEISAKDRVDLNVLIRRHNGQSLYEAKLEVLPSILNSQPRLTRIKGVMRVYATSFGNPGNKGETGHFKDGTRVRRGVVAVALPDESATGKWVYVRRSDKNGKKSRWVKMKVRDLGPWFRDDPYWSKSGREPKAVSYFKKKKRRFDGRVVVNPAGIDITPWGWQRLGVSRKQSYNHSGYVEWKFAG